jgi:hypothetical protein
VTSVESASASAAAAAATPASATIAAAESKQGEAATASSAAVAACTGRAAQTRAADAGAKDCVVSGCMLKAGAVIECAYDNEQGGEIEWICGTGKTCRALMWHESSHVAYLLRVFFLPAAMIQHPKHEGHEHPPATLVLTKQAHYHTKSKGTMVPTLFFALLPLAPVLAVHAASKKFKVAVVVDTLEEKGRWQETFQVTVSNAFCVWRCVFKSRLLSHAQLYHRAYRFQVNLKYLYEIFITVFLERIPLFRSPLPRTRGPCF